MKKYYFSIFSILLAVGMVSFQSPKNTVLYFIGDTYCLLEKQYYVTNSHELPTECDSGLDLPCQIFMPAGVSTPDEFMAWLEINFNDDTMGKLAYIYNHASKREMQTVIGDD